MIKIFLTLLFGLLLFFNVNGQVLKQGDKLYTAQLVKTDLANGNVKFLLQGGIVSIYVKGQEVFEQKYKVKYIDLGCVVPKDISIVNYNKEVAKYLDKKYTHKWRSEVRKDVVGI